ncbi:hypothetical protein L1887_04850 [Cichorium endivia]|nr:hypothetical protein L1887_04850 [Cichorium endivia]
MVYIKHMITNLGLNTWEFVYYNILLSLIMAPFMTGEYSDEAISATAFIVTGVVNKFLTVAINGEDESILV